MRRAVLAFAALGAWAGCTTFDFPAPGDSGDGSLPTTDASVLSDAGPAEASAAADAFLSPDDAARLCSRIFACPRLAEAIELSLAIPLNTPANPLGFSACMDWLAAPVDPARPGLAQQQSLLQGAARAASCATALAALPVQPERGVDAACAAGCATPNALTVCGSGGGSFVVACAPPTFAQSGDCLSDGGTAECVTMGDCTAGTSCPDSNTLRDCYAAADTSFTDYDCALSGRLCVSGAGRVAGCVVPGKLAPPCLAKQVRDACDGDSVLHCAGGLLPQTEIACGPVGGSCTTSNPAGAARCVRPGDTCTPFDADINQCDGGFITACIGGDHTTIDCMAIGATCQPADATHTAHCGS
jgi:hypothetical protein